MSALSIFFAYVIWLVISVCLSLFFSFIFIYSAYLSYLLIYLFQIQNHGTLVVKEGEGCFIRMYHCSENVWWCWLTSHRGRGRGKEEDEEEEEEGKEKDKSSGHGNVHDALDADHHLAPQVFPVRSSQHLVHLLT
jgi:hypothetical protein